MPETACAAVLFRFQPKGKKRNSFLLPESRWTIIKEDANVVFLHIRCYGVVMDVAQFFREVFVRDFEEGKAYILSQARSIEDPLALARAFKEEASKQLYADPSISLKYSELLIFFGQELQIPLAYGLGLSAKGDALSTLGYHQAALECLERAGQEFLRLGDEYLWARSRMKWLISCASAGQIEKALQEAATVRAVFERRGDRYWMCAVDLNTAIIYKQAGLCQSAIELYDRVLAIYAELVQDGDPNVYRSIAIAENNKASNLSVLGRFSEAYSLLYRARERFLALGNIWPVMITEITLADIDFAQGYYGSALKRFYQLRDLFEQHKLTDARLLAGILLQMALCLVKLGRTQEAYRLATEALEQFEPKEGSWEAGDMLHQYALILVAVGRTKEALNSLQEVVELFHARNLMYFSNIARLQKAELLLELGRWAEAATEARELRQIYQQQTLQQLLLRTEIVLADACISQAERCAADADQRQKLLQEAAELCLHCATRARQHNFQELVYKCRYLQGRLALLRGNEGQAARYFGGAIAQVERILGNLLYDLSPSFLRTTWNMYEDMIVLQLRRGKKEQAFRYLERARSISLRQYLNVAPVTAQQAQGTVWQERGTLFLQKQTELEQWQERYRKCSAQLATNDPLLLALVDREAVKEEMNLCEAKISELFEWLYVQQIEIPDHQDSSLRSTFRNVRTVDIAQLRACLQPDQVVLTYYLCRDDVVIFALTPDTLAVFEVPGAALQVERYLPLLHAHLQPAGWSDPANPPQQGLRGLLRRLHKLLIEPVASCLPPREGLITIVPYGPLHSLPFHALFDGARFLIEDFQISYLPASTLLTRAMQPVAEHKSALNEPLIFGCSGNRELPSARREALEVAELLRGRCYLEQEATGERLRMLASGAPVIHLATHGHSRLDAPNFSAVLLADGLLTAFDAFHLDLHCCELVTLSGCETGLALSGGGDEQLGLGRAFLVAGAASLVMTIWSVEDNSTGLFMHYFYHQILQGESKVQALRTAQCQLLRSSAAYAHPYFWAAFRLVGNPGPLGSAVRTQLEKQESQSV